jgi:hypothetical protein
MFHLLVPISSDMVSFDCSRFSHAGVFPFFAFLRSRKPNSVTDWFFFLVLDIGNAELAYIPVGVKFIIGFLQATSVRTTGFAAVSMSALAPVQCVSYFMTLLLLIGFCIRVLYVLMMYVSVCEWVSWSHNRILLTCLRRSHRHKRSIYERLRGEIPRRLRRR